MEDKNVLDLLLQSIKSANSLKINYGITGQKIIDDNIKKIVTFSSNINIIVDYTLEIASVETTTSDFTSSTNRKEVYKDYTKTLIETDLNTRVEKSYTKELTKEEYDDLFKYGSQLYPIELEFIVSVESEMNNDYCQVCRPCKEYTDTIDGHLESVYVVYKKNENLYDITRMMKQKDLATEMILMQYCNTKIEVLS